MADVKIQGLTDVQRLLAKSDTWTPPATLDEYLLLVRKVITTSKYTDSFLGDDQDTLANLRAFVKVKAQRIALHPDIEECVDIGAYAFMTSHRFLLAAGLQSMLTESLPEITRLETPNEALRRQARVPEVNAAMDIANTQKPLAAVQCCARDHDRDGNCDRHPLLAPVAMAPAIRSAFVQMMELGWVTDHGTLTANGTAAFAILADARDKETPYVGP